jgi:hypothetical protein
MICAIQGLDPATYVRSPLHADTVSWPEKNCYIDIWLEVVHALELEPRAMLPFVVALDFEGDQWTFFKPPHSELYELYGLDTQELTVWKTLLEHAVEHLPAGRLISTEADSFWLPDTSGTDYRRNHVKSTIMLNAIDVDAQILHYFHNTSYHRLEGEDFRQLFRIGIPTDPTFLPLYAEFIRTGRRALLPPAELGVASRRLLAKHLARRPHGNPVTRFAQRFEKELPRLQALGLAHYHQWAFGNLRQLGAAFELAATNLRWLSETGALQAEAAAAHFDLISGTCKSLVLKGARAVNTRKPLDLRTPCSAMAEAWDAGMLDLEQRLRAAA